MIKMSVVFWALIWSGVMGTGCAALKEGQTMFHVKEAWYQSWMVNDNEKGTNINIELEDVRPGVEFDSIIFRNTQLPAFVEKEGNSIKIKSILNKGVSRLYIDSKVVDKPDQLLYRLNGKRFSYPLKLVRRKMLKYK